MQRDARRRPRAAPPEHGAYSQRVGERLDCDRRECRRLQLLADAAGYERHCASRQRPGSDVHGISGLWRRFLAYATAFAPSD